MAKPEYATMAETALSTAEAALPKAGGTSNALTGKIFTTTDTSFARYDASNAGRLGLYGGQNTETGAFIHLYGKNHTDTPGYFSILAVNSSSLSKTLQGRPDGTFTWNGQAIQTSSDATLKQDASAVPDADLDAWAAMDWQRFRFKEDVARKGETARYHTGLLAQNAMAAITSAGGTPLAYGIFCKLEDEVDAITGETVAGKWTVRYEEALAMEAAYLRRELARLKARLDALEGGTEAE